MPSFDLRYRPWIPVRYVHDASGPPMIGLAELFLRAHEIADITMPVPPAASGLWRILYLIAARISGLDDLEAFDDIQSWKRARNQALHARRFDPGAAETYLSEYGDRFDLFSPAWPWLQDPRLSDECPKNTGVNKLAMGRATGNNLVWLSHDTDLAPRPVPSAEAAWYLLAWLYYGPSGKITARTVRGTTESNMTAGPLRSRISFHLLGRTLHESLIAGIPYPGRYHDGADPDLASWEERLLSDPLGLPPHRDGLSRVLTGQFRHAVLLTPSADGAEVTGARITWAWRRPHPEVHDPYLIYDTAKGKAAQYPRYARLDRAVWRDLDALLLHDTGQATSKQPQVFTDLPGIPHDTAAALQVRAFGFDQDGQTIDRQWFTATTPPVLAMDSDDNYRYGHDVKVAREAAERVGLNLRHALKRAWAAIDAGDGPWEQRGMTQYWAGAEDRFWRMLDQEFSYPDNAFIRVAVTVYEDVTSQHAARSARVTRAIEKARGGIFASWARAEPDYAEAGSA